MQSKLSLLSIIWYFISNVFPALSAFIIFTFASHSITSIELGSITLCTTIIAILINFSAVGFGDAIVNNADIDKFEIDTIFTLIFGLSLFLYLFSVLVLYFCRSLGISDLVVHIYPILAIKLLLDSISFIPLAILSKKMQFKKIAFRTVLCSILSVFISVPALIVGSGFYAIIISQVTTSIVSFLVLWLSSGYKPKLVFPLTALKRFLKFGINNCLTKIVNSFNFDNIFIGVFGNLATLGIYGFGKRVLSVFTDIISSAISNVSYPVYASLNNGDEQKLQSVFFTTIYFSVLISMPIFAGLILISDDIVPLIFGEHWIVAIPTIKFFFVFGFLSCIGSLQLSLIKAKGNTDWILKYQIFQQVTTGILALILAKYGPEIVIMAIVIKTYLTWPYTIFYISKILKVSPLKYSLMILKPIIPLVFMTSSFYLLKYSLSNVNVFVYLLLQIFNCVVIYILATFIFFRSDIMKLIKMMKPKSSKVLL